MATKKYLDNNGLTYFWSKIKARLSGKQDTLVSGTNIKTLNNTSLLGEGDISIPVISVDSAISTTSTNPVQNKLIGNALNGKLDGFTLSFFGQWTGGPHAVKFCEVDYSTANSENGIFIKFSMVNSHGNGEAGRFLQDVILNVKYTGDVVATLYRYFSTQIVSSGSPYHLVHDYGDVFWTIDTTNKIVKFFVLMHQFSYTRQTPYFRLNTSTGGIITQSNGGNREEYSSGTQNWSTNYSYDDIRPVDTTLSSTSTNPVQNKVINTALNSKANTSDLASVATSGSYNDLSDTPTIPAAQVNSDWNSTSGVSQILNKPTLASVATSGDYDDLTNTPSEVYYATSSTGANDNDKVATTSTGNFKLVTGATVNVYFENKCANSPAYLNVDGTGSVRISTLARAATGTYNIWEAGEVVVFTYTGTYWVCWGRASASLSSYGRTYLTESATADYNYTSLTPSSLNTFAQNIVAGAPVYSTSSTYAVGDKCRRGFYVYKCKTAITTPEAWTASHWDVLPSLQDQIDALSQAIANLGN